MRALFENNTIDQVFYKGYLVTMNKLKCFVVRDSNTGFQIIETSSASSWEWVRNYIDRIYN